MKKLLIASDCFIPRWDGVVRFLLEIIPSLTKDYEITIIAPNFGDFKDIPNINIIQYPIINIDFGDIEFTGFNYWKIKKLVKEADIVFSQTIGPIGISAILAGHKLKKPVISYIHSIEWELTTRSIKRFKKIANTLTRWLTKWIYNKCSQLIVPSIEVLEKFNKNKITTPKQVVHLGTDTEKFKPAKYKKIAKENVGLDPFDKIIGYSGRIGREKDLITLYRAFRRVEKNHPDAKLLIVGKGVKELEKLFTSQRNIIMTGSVDNVWNYLQAMDIFVLPSFTETSSLATMEAMATELPVITTKVGFVKEYIKEKQNGMMFPFRNSMVLAMKLTMLLENENLRWELGKNARGTIKKQFSWENTISKIKEILKVY